jgi:LuxR family maltose regulon positive regulatory protein
MTVPVAIDALHPRSPGSLPGALGRHGARALRRRGGVALLERRMTPPLLSRVVDRPRLTGPLSDVAGARVVSLLAPAGYGKTTLLCAWAESDERPFAWVTLDEADNDPACLEASVGLAVERVEARRGAGRFVLVLDDLQALRSLPARARLAALVERLPGEVTLAIASRTPPALPVARLRAQGRLMELGPRDLAMNPSEAAALLRLAGLELGPDELLGLVRRTEGWPAALALAVLLQRDGGSPADIAAFGGGDRLVGDYVRDEILVDLSEEQHTLLLETSVLDTLTGALCDAVLHRSGSEAALSQLHRERLLLVPLDRTDERFRHHRLVRETLSAELRRRDPGLVAELHRRASTWFREAGDEDRAVRHAVCAGDVAGAAELVWSTTPGAVGHGRKRDIEGWLELFTEAQIAASPTLALAAAGTHLASGQGHEVERWAWTAAAAAPASARPRAVEGGVAIMRAALGREGLLRMREDAARAYDIEPDASPWRAMCCLLGGTADLLAGPGDEAAALLREGGHRAAVVAPDIHALCLTQLAVLALADDEWEEAAGLVTRARAQVERYGLGAYPTAALVFAASALVRAHRGRVDAAQEDFRVARRLRGELTDFAAWYEVELSAVLARAAVRLSDLNGARRLLTDAHRAMRGVPDAVTLEAWLEELWAQLDGLSPPASVLPASLTTAELRILRFLPTHLSFREIAERIFVSANTVKTQANAIYRKLDVSCRSDAVTRARQLGLLDIA